ncbi:MAG: MFS transporter [Dehalococcoidia bacterium]|nr:MFS transporter [Dehalococcoidia bacterium]
MVLPRKRAGRLFYGWVIVAVAFASCVVMSAMWGSFSLFYVALVDEFGWSRTTTAGAFSVFVAMVGLSATFAGWMVDRLGPRKVMPVSAVVLASGLALASRISEPWQLYLVYGTVLPVSLSCVGIIPHLRLISNWFEARRGTAFGIATSGFGFGSVVLMPTVQYLVLHYGWRNAYLAIAGLALLLAPLTGFFHRRHPRDMGLLPDGREASNLDAGPPGRLVGATASRTSSSLGDYGLRQAMSTTNFWVVFAVNICLSLTSLIPVFQVAHIVGIGFPPMLAATISGLAGLLNAVGRMLGGFLTDRIGKVSAGLAGVLLLTLGVLASLLAGTVQASWLLFAYSLLFGLGWGFVGITAAAIIADLFQGRSYGTLAGFLELGGGIGGFIGPWLGGYIFDRYGAYTLAFAIAIVSVWICGGLFKLAYRGTATDSLSHHGGRG